MFDIFQTLQVLFVFGAQKTWISSSLGLSNTQELIRKVTTIDLLQESELQDKEIPHLTGGILSGSSMVMLTTKKWPVNVPRVLCVA